MRYEERLKYFKEINVILRAIRAFVSYKLCTVSSHAPSEVRERVSLTEPSLSTRMHQRIDKEMNI
jgi:hypothetical protein